MKRKHWTVIFIIVFAATIFGGTKEGISQGIMDTKHNLSTKAGTGSNRVINGQEIYLNSGTAEVCVFCHTPHGADTTVNAPLWNRGINTSGGYQMYSSPTLDATIDVQPTGVSLACLSCHDGTIASDALRNLPGPGGYDPNPAALGRNPNGWLWNLGIKSMSGRGVTDLGTDLRNDHPVSMVYTSAKSSSSTSGNNDFATGFYDPPKNNLPLYDGKVQCGTCHDPHRSNTQTFLRLSNDGSAVCLSCHKKDN